MHHTPMLRLATAEDIPELLRLREVMWTSMGLAVPGSDWRGPCRDVLTDWFAGGTGVAAAVDRPGGPGLVAAGVGSIEQRLPGVSNPTGRYGYIANMVTDEDHRGRGLATAIVERLLEWFAEQGIRTVDLHASAQGESIYRAHGFRENAQVALRWRAG